MTGPDLREQYNEAFKGFSEDPPPHVKEEVFQEVDEHFRRKRRRKRLFFFGVPAIVLLTLGGFSPLLFDDIFSEGPSINSNGEVSQKDELLAADGTVPFTNDHSPEKTLRFEEERTGTSSGIDESSSSESSPDRNIPSQNSENLASTSNSGPSNSGVSDMNQETSRDPKRPGEQGNTVSNDKAGKGNKREGSKAENGNIEKRKGSKAGSDERTRDLPLMDPKGAGGQRIQGELASASQTTDHADLSKNTLSLEGLFVGSDNMFNLTRLLDNRTIESFDQKSIISTKANIFYDWGVHVGYEVSENTTVLARYFTKKDVGQTYHDYVDGLYTRQITQLSYRKFDLMAEYDLSKGYLKAKYPTSFSFVGGFHYARLRNAVIQVEGEEVSVSEKYSDNEYGIDAGLRYSLMTPTGFELGIGVEASSSLNNVFDGDSQMPGDNNPTRHLSFGTDVSIRYHLFN